MMVSQYLGVQVDLEDQENQALDDGKSGMFFNYSQEMNRVIRALKRSGDFDRDNTYIFLVNRPKNPQKLGYMPKKRRYGFVFTEPHRGKLSALYKTIAHEVAHGAFRLSHPFQDFPGVDRGTTQNLMDYASGTQLRKYQWHDIHNPRMVLDQKDEDGASITECTLAKLIDKFSNNEFGLQKQLEERKSVYNDVFDNFETYITKLEANAKDNFKNNEIAKVGDWTIRGESLKNSSKYKVPIYDVMISKLMASSNTVSYNVWEKGILMGEIELDEVKHKIAIYTDEEKFSIDKLQLTDYCELIGNDSINKVLKVSDFNDYLLLTFIKNEKIKMVVQLMDSDDEKLKTMLRLFGVLKGEVKIPEREETDTVIIMEKLLTDVFGDVPNAKKIADAVNKYSNKYGINDKEKMSHFLGQIGAESGSMRSLTESCKYSKNNKTLKGFILKTNTSIKIVKNAIYKIMRNPDLLDSLSKAEIYYFNTCKDTIFSIPNDTVFHKFAFKATYDDGEGMNTTYTKANSTCGENVCCLFKYVYRFTSNSADANDDKYKLGRGFIHLTGKGNYEKYYDLWLKADDDPDYPKSKGANKERTKANYSMDDFIKLLTSDIEVAIEVSFMYWKESGLNKLILKPKEGEEIDPESDEFRNSVRRVGGKINAWDKNIEEVKIGAFDDRLENSKKIFNNL